MGEINARVAERDDFINDVHIVPTLRNYEEYRQDETITKKISCDKYTNKFGLDLIKLCKTYMIQTCNGRYVEDKGISHFTVISTKRK